MYRYAAANSHGCIYDALTLALVRMILEYARVVSLDREAMTYKGPGTRHP